MFDISTIVLASGMSCVLYLGVEHEGTCDLVYVCTPGWSGLYPSENLTLVSKLGGALLGWSTLASVAASAVR